MTVSNRYTQTCSIIEPPKAGRTGSTTIATSVLCTFPYPANNSRWAMGSDFRGFEIHLDTTETAVTPGMILEMPTGKFIVEKVNLWPKFTEILARNVNA